MGARALHFNLYRAECYFFVQNAISSCRMLFLRAERYFFVQNAIPLCRTLFLHAERYFERISATPKTDARQGCCSCSGGRQ